MADASVPETPGLRARDLMRTPLVSASLEASVRDVQAVFHLHAIDALPLHLPTPTSAPRRWAGQITRVTVEQAIRLGLADCPVWQVSDQAPEWLSPDTLLSSVHQPSTLHQGRTWLVGAPGNAALGSLDHAAILAASSADRSDPIERHPPRSWIQSRLAQALGTGWPAVQQLGALAAEHHTTCWLVGGGVRDLFRDTEIRDADIVVEGDATTLARVIADRLGGEVVVHDAFGTAKWTPPDWRPGQEPIDIASARGEHYPHRAALPVVERANLHRDLHRRDFTINAMAVCIHPDRVGEVLDPYGGWVDLQRGVLQVLHGLSFQDDPTRVLRAARFAARFDLSLTPNTRRLISGAIESAVFAELSPDRLGAEIERVLSEVDPVAALQTLCSWELLPALHPSWDVSPPLFAQLTAVIAALREGTARLQSTQTTPPTRADCAWLVLSDTLEGHERRAFSAMIPGNKARRERFVAGMQPIHSVLRTLAHAPSPSEIASSLEPLDAVQWVVALGLARQQPEHATLTARLWWWMEQGRALRTTVDGRWLMAQGHRPGPRFKAALRTAQLVAWDGGDAAAQEAAAVALLSPA